ncbi:hypothetical protein [Argonema galeatum]|nr:hypothetical protein [Argonema galeatum]
MIGWIAIVYETNSDMPTARCAIAPHPKLIAISLDNSYASPIA